MPLTAITDDRVALWRRQRTVMLVRWVGVAFGVLQVALYDTMPVPEGVPAVGFGIVAAVAAANLVIAVVLHRGSTPWARPTAVVSLVLDAAALSAFAWLYAFDPVSALFALLVLAPIEGALLFGLGGAMLTWAGVAVAYVGREWFATRYGNPWEWDSITFRIGLMGMVALIVGLLARDLQAQRHALAAALADSRRADAWRARLVTMLAHDLRSPLASSRTGLATLRQHHQDMSSEAIDRVTAGGIRQVDRMLAMTRDLLDLARAEQGRLTLYPRPVVLRDVVDDAMALVGTSPELVEVDVPADLVLVADPERLEQVLANLLANALRHGAPPVEVDARAEGGMAFLSVRDHGPGLPPGLADHVFEPFATSEDGSRGVGLGTWVVGHLVEAHGGTVHHEDAQPGARFVVTLPARPLTGPAVPPARSTAPCPAPR